MDYVLLNLNDEIMINIDGIGLVPYISLYPSLWKLYIERMNLNSEYLVEVIKGMEHKLNKADIYLKKINKINADIKYETLSLGLALKIPVQIMGEIDNNYILKSLITNNQLYIDKKNLNASVISEFEAKKEAITYKKTNRRKVR